MKKGIAFYALVVMGILGCLACALMITYLTQHMRGNPTRLDDQNSCKLAGQIIKSERCSPVAGQDNGRYVCRTNAAGAPTKVCESRGTKVTGGVVYHDGVSIPPSVGTIRCVTDEHSDSTMIVTITGEIASGLIAQIPQAAIDHGRVEIGSDLLLENSAHDKYTSCWSNNIDCFSQPVTTSIAIEMPRSKFTPRLRLASKDDNMAVVYFDLRSWTIANECVRQGCGFCRDGENCSDDDRAECIVSSLRSEDRQPRSH